MPTRDAAGVAVRRGCGRARAGEAFRHAATSPRSASRIATSRSAPPARSSATRRQRSKPRSRTCARSTVEAAGEFLALDAATRRNLEITETLRGEAAPTLLSLLDTCAPRPAAGCCGTGSRIRCARRTRRPARHAAVAAWVDASARAPRRCTRSSRHTVDVERIAARIALGSARPRDLAGLRDTLARLPAIAATLAEPRSAARAPRSPPTRTSIRNGPSCSTRAIAPEPAAQVRDGGVIAKGYDAELDELRAIDDHCGEFLVALEARERERTGIANLKVEYNRVHGFYIEVTHANAEKVPDDYRRRQTLKNAERYITPELKAFEDKALSAQERALAREKLLYDELLAAARAGDPGVAARGGGARDARRARDVRRARRRARPRAARVRRTHRASRSAAGGIRSSSARSRRSSRTTSTSRPIAGC